MKENENITTDLYYGNMDTHQYLDLAILPIKKGTYPLIPFNDKSNMYYWFRKQIEENNDLQNLTLSLKPKIPSPN